MESAEKVIIHQDSGILHIGMNRMPFQQAMI